MMEGQSRGNDQWTLDAPDGFNSAIGSWPYPRDATKKICAKATTVYVPLSHPFVEQLMGTIRRLDRTLIWTSTDLELKLLDFQRYYHFGECLRL
jgi:hypothetical protein